MPRWQDQDFVKYHVRTVIWEREVWSFGQGDLDFEKGWVGLSDTVNGCLVMAGFEKRNVK